MKKIFLRFLCVFCAAVIVMSSLSFGVMSPASADEPIGKMASVYGYILNDYIESYGVMSTNAAGAVTDSKGELVNPGGVIYGDIMNFDRPDCPYLVIFLADNARRTAACHLWMYSDETEQATRIAVIERTLDSVSDTRRGELSMEWGEDRQYIVYREYENFQPITEQFYTVINGETFMLVNNPSDTSFTGIIGFNKTFVNAGVDISDYNNTLDQFFSKLKDTSSDSVSSADISGRLSDDDRDSITKALINASLYADFDISRYKTAEERDLALTKTTSDASYTSMSSFYDLGDGICYSQFSTDRTKYNYAVLRKSDKAPGGWQLLKSRLDGIPLSDRELRQMKMKYLQSPLVDPQSNTDLKLTRAEKRAPLQTSEAARTEASENPDVTPLTVTIGDETVVIPASTKEPDDKRLIEPVISVKKVFDDRVKIPAACIGGGITAAVVTILWVYMFSGNDE